MDAYDVVITKLDVKEFDSKPVPRDVKLKILEAARLTGSGINSQHWRFILVQDPKNLRQLADDSTSGKWVQGANFAVVVLTDPKLGFHLIDAGRVTQDMQVAAWSFGVASRLYTGFDQSKMRKDLGIPANLEASIVVGFGYPANKITGKMKNRKPLEEIAFLEKFGNMLERSKVI
ncbi:MAG TPA: nitroreductase family protein [Nitrososphaerales archaeon]|nr:nitroreductase family protein [Nitrososphaerales archaeon]